MEFPEANLVNNTYTIRNMDFPPSIKMTKRSLLRWFALAFGLISEKESRATVLEVLDSLFYFIATKNYSPTSADILLHLKSNKKEISEKLLRYHLKRMVDLKLLERKKLKYSFAKDPHEDKNNLSAGFKHNISSDISKALTEIEQALTVLSSSYKKK